MKEFKKRFPIFRHKESLMYLDSAASSQKPQSVIDAISHFYAYEYAPIQRGIYALAEQATEQYESVRKQVAHYIQAQDSAEIIFTKGATEGINLIARAWGKAHIKAGDEIVLTEMEHHANLLPWQELAHTTGAILKFIPIKDDFMLDYSCLDTIITEKTKLISVVHVSNATGTHNDMSIIKNHAQRVGARFLIDACQSAAHQPINVQELQCDFLVFSAHKMFGPTGLGVLYINSDIFDEVPVYEVGGGMVFESNYYNASYVPAPHKYEAGTPPIAQVIGFGAAIDFIQEYIDFEVLRVHEARLCSLFIDGLLAISGATILGPIEQLRTRGHLVTFILDNIHPHDIAAFLSERAICVRAGHFCVQPLFKKLGLAGAVRVSFSGYSHEDDVHEVLSAIIDIKEII